MTEWVSPHWTGRPQPKPDRRRRLKPNGFARLARLCARNSMVVIVALLFLTALALSFAVLSLRIDLGAPPRIVLDAQTLAAQEALARDFPGVDETFVAHIEEESAEAARGRAIAIAAALSERSGLFASAFVPGAGAFYETNAILFRDAASIEAAVERALQMQPLYLALRSAPDLAGFAALVSEIGRAVSQGRSPPDLGELLRAAASAIEGEIEGSPRPIDWPKLAGLAPEVEVTRWFVIAAPQPGKEREAAAFAVSTAQPGSGIHWYFPQAAQGGENDIGPALIAPVTAAIFISLVILGLGLGTFKFAVPVAVTAFASLFLTAGFAGLIIPVPDAASWSFAPACLAPAFLFSIVFVLAYLQSRQHGAKPLTAIMLAAQRRGLLLLALAIVAEIFWLAWLPRQLPSLTETAAIGAVGTALAFLLTLTLAPAVIAVLDRGEEVDPHWLDAAVARPLGSNLRNGRQILVLLIVAAAIFCGVFVPGLRFGDAPRPMVQQASLDTPVAQDAVHFLVGAEDAARAMVDGLARLPQTGAIRWAEQFLPTGTERKLQSLRRLDGFLAGPPAPHELPAEATLSTILASLETGFRQISNDPATKPGLRQATHRLRRAFSLFANPGPPAPARVEALEAALFSGLENLSSMAAQLAKIGAPGTEDLDPALRRRFVSANGIWRIEVLPKPGVRRLAFAAAMRKFSGTAAGAPVVA
ncbi:MAG: hypothetical protein ACREDU_00540, partial [Methylocella sp.]